MNLIEAAAKMRGVEAHQIEREFLYQCGRLSLIDFEQAMSDVPFVEHTGPYCYESKTKVPELPRLPR